MRLDPAGSGSGFALSTHETDRDRRWAVLAWFPQIRLLQEHGLRFLPAARAGDHPHLQAQLDRSDAALVCGSLARGSGAGPPAAGGAGCETECCEPRSESPGAAEFGAAGVHLGLTDLSVRPDHASELARAARSRWKIENETFNTLKNVQYLEHNFGHGTQHLSDIFAALMLLAFLIDQVLEMACPIMKRIFAKCYIRTATWGHLRSSLCAVAFRNRQELYGHALGIYTAYLPTTRPDGRPPPPAQ